MMYMQELWGDQDWVPSAGAASSTQPQSSEATAQCSIDPLVSNSQGEVSSRIPEEIGADPTDSSSPQSYDSYRCMAVRSSMSSPRRLAADLGSSSDGRASQVRSNDHNVCQVTGSEPPSKIGVPTSNPLGALRLRSVASPPTPAVRRIDESSFTPNVEDLLAGLTAPLDVVHNVSPAEVRQHLAKWRPAAKAELDTFDSMRVVRRFFGEDARAILRDPAIEVIPGKAVCTVKPGEPYKRKFRVVSCGNFAKSTAESQLYAGGAGAESLRALLVHAGGCGRRAYGLDVKSAFLLAPIPTTVTKRYAMRPPPSLGRSRPLRGG